MQVIINGQEVEFVGPTVTYDNVIEAAGHKPGMVVTVTWATVKAKPQVSGGLLPGESVELREGMVFNAIITGNA